MAPIVTSTDIPASSTELTTVHWLICAVLFVLIVIGTILNFIAVFTYLRKHRRKPTHIFTLCLATVDFFNCMIITLTSLRLHGMSRAIETVVCILQPYLSHSGTLISGGLVVAVAFERYNKVSSPFRVAARGNYWSVVLAIAVIGVALPSTIPVYRAVGYRKTWIPVLSDNKTIHEDYDINDIIRDPGIFIPATFYGIVILLFFVSFILICVKYVNLSRLIISKRRLGYTKTNRNTDRRESVVVLRKTSTESAGESRGRSSTCSEYNGDPNFKNSKSDLKTRDSAVFTVYSPQFYNNLSQIITRSPENMHRPKRQKDRKEETPRSRANSVSIATRSTSRSPLRTIFMLTLAVISFLLYIPCVCLTVLEFIKPSIKEGLSSEMRIIFTILEKSYVIVFILNPILYTFCNYGFRGDFIRAFGCRGLCGRSFRARSSSLGTPRSSGDFHSKVAARTRSCRRSNMVPPVPFITELEDRLLCINKLQRLS